MLLSDIFNEYTRTLEGSREKLIPRTPFIGVSLQIQFHPWFKFYFILFLGMVMYMYDNAFETKKIKFKPRMELNHN